MGDVGVGDRKWWGPRIWRILHTLAEISDRGDCGPAWRVVLRETAEMLPCAVCRTHFLENMRHIRFEAGRAPRAELRRWLWSVHAGTGGALPFEDLSAEYGHGGDRYAAAAAAIALIEEVFRGLRDGRVLDRFMVGHLIEWHRGALLLARLLQTPELIRTRTRYR